MEKVLLFWLFLLLLKNQTLGGGVGRVANFYMSTAPTTEIASGASGSQITGARAFDVTIQIGSFDEKVRTVIDTASELIWIKEKGAKWGGNPTEEPSSIFLSYETGSMSKSLVDIPCNHRICVDLISDPRPGLHVECDTQDQHHQRCNFRADYMDGIFAIGRLVSERITVSIFEYGQASIPIVFGLASKTNSRVYAHGLLGLNRGAASLPSQLRPFLGGGSFGTCLGAADDNAFDTDMAHAVGAYLYLGDSQSILQVQGLPRATDNLDTMATPFMSPSPKAWKNYYLLQLHAVIVGGTTITAPPAQEQAWQRLFMIDSGGTSTRLRPDLFDEVVSTITKQMNLIFDNVDGEIQWDVSHMQGNFKDHFPEVQFMIQGIFWESAFDQTFRVRNNNGRVLVCLRFREVTDDELEVLGMFNQMERFLLYDAEHGNVGRLVNVPMDVCVP